MLGELVVEESQTQGKIKINFDERTPGLVIVQAGGERVRIDTTTKTWARLEDRPKTPAPNPSQPQVVKAEQAKASEREPYDYRLVNVPTPKRVLRHSLNLYFTHRFSEPIKPLNQSATDLLGLDSTAVSTRPLLISSRRLRLPTLSGSPSMPVPSASAQTPASGRLFLCSLNIRRALGLSWEKWCQSSIKTFT